MEAAGLSLAILPLIINQLDNYVQGLETIKSFGAKRYRRELDSWSAGLGNQKAIFVNTLERVLDGVTEYGDGLDELMKNPLGDLWKKQTLRASLCEKLGRDVGPFDQTMKEIATLLQDLSQKLGLDHSGNYQVNKSIIKREVKKFRDIFSRSIYNDLFRRIDSANRILKTLVEQSDYRSTMQRRKISKRPLLRQRRARASARSLHNAIVPSKYWKCGCVDRHFIHFVLNYPPEDFNGGYQGSHCGPRFRMIFPSRSASCGLEVEAESDHIQSNVHPLYESRPGIQAKFPAMNSRNEVQAASNLSIEHKDCISGVSSAPPIVNICSTLSTVGTNGETNALIGCLSDENHRHNMYYVRSLAENLTSESLAELIAASSDISKTPGGSFFFTRGHRLRIAVNLACSVLRFHGNWLRTYWRSRDIMFTKNASGYTDESYARWNVGCELDAWNMCRDKTNFSLIQSEALFPLGLVLVELSLCRTLEALQTPEDEDRVEAYGNLRTASRLLPVVKDQSGDEYEKVARRCLFWTGTKEPTLDGEQMQDEIFQFVISPLIEDLRSFEGRRLE